MMMTDGSPQPSTSMAVAAAAFLAQALHLPDAPEDIATELVPIKDDRHAAIYSIEVDSSIGEAAFLVYVYRLDLTDADGTAGAKLFQEGSEALRRAEERDTPGPRMVAQAETERMGFILATTPATWRALQGDTGSSVVATESHLPSLAVSAERRSTMAEDLHRSLRETSEHAKTWLAAIRSTADPAAEMPFTEEETALALFVLDSANVQPLLTALNVLVTTAQEQAAGAVRHGDTEPENTEPST